MKGLPAPVASMADRLAAWFNSLPDGGMGKEHFDALLSIAASPQAYGVRAAVIEECAREIDQLAALALQQFEALDVSREINAYAIAANAIRALSHTEQGETP